MCSLIFGVISNLFTLAERLPLAREYQVTCKQRPQAE
jgi:hypothetical protein